MKNNIDLLNQTEIILKPKKKIRPLTALIIIISLVIIIFSYIFFTNYSLVSSYDDKVYPGVYLLDKDLSSLNSEDLLKELNLLATMLTNKKIIATSPQEEFIITYNELEYTLNVDELAKEIISYGKDKSFVNKLNLIKESPKKEFQFSSTYNNEILDEFINNVYDNLYIYPINATIDISYGINQVINETLGTELNSNKLKEEITLSLNDFKTNSDVNLIAETVDITPLITAKDLNSINKRISTFSTKFIYGPSGTNLQVASDYIDNIVVMPGETFSTEKAIGPTTLETGFVYSNTYLNGEVVKGLGGGVCQVSSTLYNTMLNAGIIPIERFNHMMPVGYIATGLDATLADNLIDLKFVNEYDYPIVINSSAVNGVLTIEFWSNEASDDGINYQTYRDVISDLNVDTYLQGYDSNGSLVSNQFLDRSTYSPLP